LDRRPARVDNRHHVSGVRVFAPARVDLSPGFTDVAPLCAEAPGRVVNVALDLGIEVIVGDYGSAASFAGRLCAAVALRLEVPCPAVYMSASPLPLGSGLGASGALSVALAHGVSLLAGTSVAPADLVALACGAERDTGLTGGTQDQLASVHGGAGLVTRYRDLGTRAPIDADLGALADRLVLVYASGSRNSGSIIEQVLARPRVGVMRTIAAMNRVGDLMAESLSAGAFDQVADLMTESTALLRALNGDIVSDGVEDRLRALGALAAKPCGAGGPGAVWVTLVEPTARAAFVDGVTSAGLAVLPAAPSGVGTTAN
jgi:galactokinase/mevalonate kinase-like predicted kinase